MCQCSWAGLGWAHQSLSICSARLVVTLPTYLPTPPPPKFSRKPAQDNSWPSKQSRPASARLLDAPIAVLSFPSAQTLAAAAGGDLLALEIRLPRLSGSSVQV